MKAKWKLTLLLTAGVLLSQMSSTGGVYRNYFADKINVVVDPNDTNNDGYYDADVAAVNAIITVNGLSAIQNDPADWEELGIVIWAGERPLRIKDLFLYKQSLTGTLDVSALTELETLSCDHNQLTELTGLRRLTKLNGLYCSKNRLTVLDTSVLKNLTSLQCDYNPLISLKQEKKKQLTVGTSTNGTVKLTDYTFSIYSIKPVELTAIPKTNYAFKEWRTNDVQLEDATANPVVFPMDGVITITPVFENQTAGPNDINNDGYHDDDVAAINAIISINGLSAMQNDPAGWTGWADWGADWPYIATWNNEHPRRITNLSIKSKSLTGKLDVSALTSLTALDCRDNQLAALDVSALTSLTVLDCCDNQLTALDVSNLTSLTELNCANNQLTELNGLYSITDLNGLYCHNNQLTQLEVSHLTSLTELYCSSNRLTQLEVSHLKSLTRLECDYNPLTSLKLEENKQLTVDSATNGRVNLTGYKQRTKSITLTAIPKTNYSFIEWQTNDVQLADSFANPAEFILDGNITIMPVFENYSTYTVKKGDTLWAISRRYGCTLEALVAANPFINDPDFILVGWELNIP